MKNTIQIFEWETLKEGDVFTCAGNTKAEVKIDAPIIEELIKWQDGQRKLNDHKDFFKVGYKKITFTQWVGVVQVKDLVIEILPKAEKNNDINYPDLIQRWSSILQIMLADVNKLPLRQTERTNLNIKRQNLMDLYFTSFLNEVESIVHRGLVKKYRVEAKNRGALKGKLNFNKQVIKNLVHKEHFYTEAQEYDKQNSYNEILLEAIKVTSNYCTNSDIRSRAKSMVLDFPDWPSKRYSLNDFERLTFDRKTDDYKRGIILAELIILQLNPQFQSGSNKVMALFFDMNRLWEDWLLSMFKRASVGPSAIKGLKVLGKRREKFWKSADHGNKILETDILVEMNGEKIVFDAKWKLPKNNKPNDDDLKQMFTYNMMYGSKRSILLMPSSEINQTDINGEFGLKRSNDVFDIAFHNESDPQNEEPFSASMSFVPLNVSNGKIETNWIEGLL